MILQGKHILIVEDNMLNRVVYVTTLGLQGAVLEFDRSGSEALAKLKSVHNWDLIILDLMLPRGMSGFELFKAIRAIPHYQAIPIIAISASEPSVAIPRAQELGFSGFISKPIDEALICDQLARVIEGEHIWHDGISFPR